MTAAGLDLRNPAFAPIRARFARVYMGHKADLGVPDASDDDILRHVDDITLTLMRGVDQALLQGDEPFLRKYRWFTAVLDDLLADLPAKLDG